MNNELSSKFKNQKGSALIVVVLVLMVVTVIGLLSSRTAVIEEKLTSNDKTHKMTWAATDADCYGLMPELIEKNIEERGFGDTSASSLAYGNTTGLQVFTGDFYLNDTCAIPSETNRDVEVSGIGDTDVYISIFGASALTPGNAIQLPEGYHGRGKGLAGGGAMTEFIIRGLGKGKGKSQIRVSAGWRHLT